VLAELLDEEVDEVVGPNGRHDPDRTAVRHGHEAGEVRRGGRRVSVERPRARAADGSGEVPRRTYRHFADRDPLTRVLLEQYVAAATKPRACGAASSADPGVASRCNRRCPSP
jgi:putative transposase